jgi:hypothetical protein
MWSEIIPLICLRNPILFALHVMQTAVTRMNLPQLLTMSLASAYYCAPKWLSSDKATNVKCTELLGLFWTLSIVLYVEDKRPQRFGDWICLRNVVVFCLPHTRRLTESKTSPIALYNIHHRQNPFKSNVKWIIQQRKASFLLQYQ